MAGKWEKLRKQRQKREYEENVGIKDRRIKKMAGNKGEN